MGVGAGVAAGARVRAEAYFSKLFLRKRFLLKKYGGRGYGRIGPPPGPSYFGSPKLRYRPEAYFSKFFFRKRFLLNSLVGFALLGVVEGAT